MAATLLPRRRGVRRRWLVAGVLLIIVAIVAGLVLSGPPAPARASQTSLVTVTRGDIASTISASGAVAAEQTLALSFQTGGTVDAVLVVAGDRVTKGQALARLDDRALRLQLTNAQAALASAQARLTQAEQGNARPEDIASAEAALAQAQASYDKLTAGADAADLASAQAQLASAQSAYQAAVASASTGDSQLDASRAALEKAQISLEQAQVDYADAIAKDSTDSAAAAAYQRAQVDYAQAQANYDSLAATVSVDADSRVRSAASQVEQARANLAKVTDSAGATDIASAQAGIDQARANLARLTGSATETDLTIQRSAVTQAEQSVRQAELNLEQATLVAPFDGIVTNVSLIAGGQAGPTAAVTLMDDSLLHVDLKLNENDVAQAALGQEVRLTVDSLDGWQATGTIDRIAPAADIANGVATYAVRVIFSADDPRLKVGMTANLDILTASRQAVLLVPSTALLPKGAGHVVQVPAAGGVGFTDVEVSTGLSDGVHTEITAGLNEGDRVVAVASNGSSGPVGPFGFSRGG